MAENPSRFKRAFQNIKMHLETFLKKHPKFKDPEISFQEFEILFDALTERNNTRNRIKKWKNLMVDSKFFTDKELNEKPVAVFDYDENRWLEEAFANFNHKKFHQRIVKDVELKDRFENSNWYKYYQAVGWYKNEFFKNCSRCGLVIPR